jgi:hypothetical protein
MTKASLALSKWKDAHQAGAWKRAMIDAELCSRVVVKTRDRNSNDKRPQGTTSYVTTSNSATPSAE